MFLCPVGFNSVGIFRKSGGKARIHNLKEMMEGNQGNAGTLAYYCHSIKTDIEALSLDNLRWI